MNAHQFVLFDDSRRTIERCTARLEQEFHIARCVLSSRSSCGYHCNDVCSRSNSERFRNLKVLVDIVERCDAKVIAVEFAHFAGVQRSEPRHVRDNGRRATDVVHRSGLSGHRFVFQQSLSPLSQHRNLQDLQFVLSEQRPTVESKEVGVGKVDVEVSKRRAYQRIDPRVAVRVQSCTICVSLIGSKTRTLRFKFKSYLCDKLLLCC